MRLTGHFTIDANVFVSSMVRQEGHHADSERFLRWVTDEAASAVVPALLLVETVAGVTRRTGEAVVSQRAFSRIESFPGMRFVDLDLGLARLAASLASTQRLRGADAVYLAVAQRYGTTLITWDTEMLQRGPAVLPTLTPTDWLASL